MKHKQNNNHLKIKFKVYNIPKCLIKINMWSYRFEYINSVLNS